MQTKNEIIEQLKLDNPTLKIGNDDDGYVELSADEYDSTINAWADAQLAKLARQAEAETKAQAKAALLSRLGITAEEAQLLLGGN